VILFIIKIDLLTKLVGAISPRIGKNPFSVQNKLKPVRKIGLK
jgi:hypothetical protein